MSKRVKWMLSGLAAGAVILAIATLLAIRSNSFQQWILRQAEQVAAQNGIQFTARQLHLDYFRLRAELEGLVYDDGKGSIIKAERVALEMPWNGWRSDPIRITDLEIDGLQIDLHPDPNAPPSPAGATIPGLSFSRLQIRNGSLNYADAGGSYRIPAFNIDVREGRGTLTLPSAVALTPDISAELPELAIALSDRSLDFGPSQWKIRYRDTEAAGSASGHLEWAPAVSLKLEYNNLPLTYQGWRDIESSASVVYEDGNLSIQNLQLRTANGTATGSADIRGAARTVRLKWQDFSLDPAGIPATTEGEAQLQWQAEDFSDLSGNAAVNMTSRVYGRAHSDIRIEKARADLEIRATAMDTNIQGRLKTGLDHKLAGTFTAINNRFGKVRLDGVLNGTLEDPRVHGTLQASEVRYGDIGPLSASAATSFASRTLSVDDIQVKLKNSGIPAGNLRVDLDHRSVRGNIPEIRVALADFAPEVQGTLILSATLDGSVEEPHVRFSGQSTGIDASNNHIDQVQLAGEATPKAVHLSELTAVQGSGTLRLTGDYLIPSDALNATAAVNDFRVDQVADLSAVASLNASARGSLRNPEIEFSGRVRDLVYRGLEHGNIELSGIIHDRNASVHAESDKYRAIVSGDVALSAPFVYDLNLTADQSALEYQQYRVTAAGRVESTGTLQPFDARRIRFDDFTLKGMGADIVANGSFPEGANVKASANLSQLPSEGIQLTGRAELRATVSGSLNNPKIEGSLETANATLQTPEMTGPASIEAAVDFTRNEFLIRRLQAGFEGATANISGSGSLDGKGRFQFQARDIHPERMLENSKIAGDLGVEGELDVSGPSLDKISGSARVTQLDLRLNDVPVRQVEPIEITLEHQILTARSLKIEGFDTQATVSGTANLATRALNFNVDGSTDLKILEAFLPGSNPAGRIQTRVALRGTPEQPDLTGFLNLSNLQMEVAEPPLSLSNTNAEIRFNGNRIEISSAGGDFNGGKFSARGGADIVNGGLGATRVELQLDDAATEYPEGFHSEISSRLALSRSGNVFEISGNVDVVSGIYRRDIDLTQEVLSRVTTSGLPIGPVGPQQPSAVDAIRLDITVSTPGVVSVSNNLANFDMEGTFRLTGTVGNPVITGRASVEEGGEIYFGAQVGSASSSDLDRRDKYVITQGTINFNNRIRTEPDVDFVATRELQTSDERYIITLRASGTTDNLKTELTSDPELDQPDIVSLLLTGRKLEQLYGSELQLAQEQAANYLSGRFGNLFQSAGSAFGLSTVRIDPVLLANEEDLSARLTLGRDITPKFNLIYSQNLSGPRAQTWIASYKAIQDLLIRGINRSDENNLTLELRHDLKWGGGPALSKMTKPKDEQILGNVNFSGNTLPTRDLLKRVTRPGKPFNNYRMNEDIRKLQQYLAARDFLAANIRGRRTPNDDKVDVQYLVEEGPTITFAYEGMNVPRGIRQEIRQLWVRGFAESSSLRESQERLLRHLRDEGYLQALLTARDESADTAHRKFVFAITPGPKFSSPKWVFKGISPIRLDTSPGAVLADPKAVQSQIQSLMYRDGYLNATASEPELVIHGREAQFEISVEQGPRYSIGTITADDPAVLTSIPPGDGGHRPGEGMFTAAWLDRARQNIVNHYWERGFNDVEVDAESHMPPTGTTVDIHFKIIPGEQQIFKRIEIEGNGKTSLKYIRRQFTFKEGDPVDLTRVNLTRKNLYDTRLFRRVDLSVVPEENGYVARTRLNEKAPWELRYGFAVTDQLQTNDRQFGVNADLSYANLLGRGITTGTSVKFTADQREVRLFSSLPILLGKRVTTTAAVFRTRDITRPDTPEDPTFISDIQGFTIQQQWQLKHLYVLSYDYSYKHNHTFDPNADPEDPFAFDITFPVARFNGTLTRDTRDDILNATRGNFLSNSFEIAPPGVGSSIQFVKNYAQFFRFEPLRQRMVLASAVRFGLAKPFNGTDLIPTERFHGGGGTTVRAFQQDQLAPGGNALLIANQELRFPIVWRFSGVGFMDVGNVYPTIRDVNPFKLRYSPGAGLRVLTPLVLIRLDLGFNVASRFGEPRYRFAFGVGQAF